MRIVYGFPMCAHVCACGPQACTSSPTGLPCVHMRLSCAHMRITCVHMGTPRVHIRYPCAHTGFPFVHRGFPCVHLETPTTHMGSHVVTWSPQGYTRVPMHTQGDPMCVHMFICSEVKTCILSKFFLCILCKHS